VDPLIGNSRIEVKNINKMYSELVSKISEPLNSKVKEVEEKDKIIKEQSDLILIKDKEIAQKDTKIKDLTQTTKQLESAFMVNYKQLEAIKKDFKTKVANQIKRLNLINRLRRSNIAQRIRNRLSKKLNSNQIDR
jgi:predicted metal-binding protein